MATKAKPDPLQLNQAAELLDATVGQGSATAEWLRLQAVKAASPSSPSPRLGKMRPETRARLEALHELWMQGKTVFQIADELHIPYASLSQNIQKARGLGLCPLRQKKTLPTPPRGTEFPEIVLPIGLPLFARFKGVFFRATVIASGISVYDVGCYSSLSVAAMAAAKAKLNHDRPLNGWEFWRVRLNNGKECFASNLRVDSTLLNQLRDPTPVSAATLVTVDSAAPVSWAVVCSSNLLSIAPEKYTDVESEIAIRGEATIRRVDGPSCVVRLVDAQDSHT